MKETFTLFIAGYGPFKGFPAVISCTLYDEERKKATRGVSICSVEDLELNLFTVKEGKIRAKNKALRAMKGRGNEYITRKEAISVLLTTHCPFTKGIDSVPFLTFQEKKELFGRNKTINRENPITNEEIEKVYNC